MPRLLRLLAILCLAVPPLAAPPAMGAQSASPHPDAVRPERPAESNAEPSADRLLAEAEAFTAQFDRELEEQEWRDQLAGWEARLAEAENYSTSGQYNSIQSGELYDALSDLRVEVEARRTHEAPRPGEVQALLDALGPAPVEDEAAESAEIAERRERYRAGLARLRERLTQVELADTRARRLQAQISELRRDALLDQISERFPEPWRPGVLHSALGDAATQARALLAAPAQWYGELDERARQRLLLWPFSAILLCAVLSGWLMRRVILRRYGRDPALRNPAPSRRVVAAVAEGVARGLIPALLFGGLLAWLQRTQGVFGGLFADLLGGLLLAAAVFSMSAALTRAVLSPKRPEWRLTAQSAESANAVGYAMLGLLTALSLELAYDRATAELATSAELRAGSVALFTLLKGGFLLLLLRRRLWHRDHRERARRERRGGQHKLLFQRLLVVVVWAALGAAALGYSTLADFLLSRLLHSIALLLLLLAVRALIRELAAALTRSRLLRRTLELRSVTLRRLKFWFRVLFDPLIYLLAALWLVQIWGVPSEDLLRWTQAALTGFEIGSITISVADIAFALLVFVVAMALTRLLQRGLLNHALPQLTDNEGLHHSLSAAAGYLGLMIAIMLFVAALGINLESVALVAGALSVGIGFGLQNVVSNFVSGLILIVERPIKVGDWVLVGGNEGFVQNINFRATELQTFERASVIIPNAELISTPVVNMTYDNRLARVEVPLRVDYASDPERVREILLDCARAHEQVYKLPEPFVLLRDFGESALLFELRCFIGEATYKPMVGSDLRFAILRALRAAGIGIPYPQRVVHFAGPAGAVPGGGDDSDDSAGSGGAAPREIGP